MTLQLETTTDSMLLVSGTFVSIKHHLVTLLLHADLRKVNLAQLKHLQVITFKILKWQIGWVADERRLGDPVLLMISMGHFSR